MATASQTPAAYRVPVAGAGSNLALGWLPTKDEDDMSSDSAVHLPTQQSVKAYVDDKIREQSNTDVDTGTETVDTFADTDAPACVWHYVVQNGANLRAGTITACWDATGNTVKFSERSTEDVGSTSGVSFEVDISGDQVRLRCAVGSDNWAVHVKRMLLGG